MAKRSPLGSWEEKWVSIDDMDRDPTFNRLIDDNRCANMAATFDPDVFGVPQLSERNTGRFVILDGQHRIQTLRLMGWNGQLVKCQVKTDLTRQEEAALFIRLQEHRSLRNIDHFIARMAAHDPVAIPIAKIVMDAGYSIDRATRDGVISAVKALEDVYVGRGQRFKGLNPDALRRTLACVTDAWGRTKAAVNGQVIGGVGAFFLRYGDAPDVKRVTAKLSRIVGGPEGLVVRGKGKRELHGGTISSGIAHYLTDDYNRGLRGKGRLPGWRESEADE